MADRPTDHLEPAAKKRGSDRQLTKDDGSGSDEEVSVVFFSSRRTARRSLARSLARPLTPTIPFPLPFVGRR